MALSEAINTILSGVSAISSEVGTKIYPVAPPQGTAFPVIVYTITSEQPTDAKDGVSPLDEVRVQIDIYGKTYAQVTTLKEAVRTALDRYAGTVNNTVIQSCRFDTSGDGDYNPDINVFWRSVDLIFRIER